MVTSFRWLALVLFPLLLLAPRGLAAGQAQGDDYDRLDGMGKSGEKVQVIEWEGNLEIHVYPAGSLQGLALKLDKRDQNKPVMVIGYRFANDPKTQLIRRAILGIPIAEGFRAFKDPSETDFDKIIISNNTLASDVVAFRLDPPPAQLYPDGYPALAGNSGGQPANREPANDGSVKNQTSGASGAGEQINRDTGTIRPFF